jgi:hypothetical protein
LPDRLRHRALGYIRVSSYLGRDREDSLTEPLQLEKIQQWCAVADLELVDVLRDLDRSGKDFDGRAVRRSTSCSPAWRPARPRRLWCTACPLHRDFYETIRTVRRLRMGWRRCISLVVTL